MSDTLRFVCVGDLHLDKPRLVDLFGRGVNRLCLDEVRRVLEYALEHGIQHVFWLGDIGDGASLSDSSELALLELLFEYDGRLHSHIILGNHDVEQRDVNSLCKIALLQSRSVFKTTRVYSERTTRRISGVTVEFLPFPETEARETGSIVVGHFERPGARRDNGGVFAADHGVPEPDTDNVWILGHLHTPHTVGRSHFSGTLYQCSFGERPEKSFLDVRARVRGGRLETRITAVPHEPAFRLLTVQPKTLADLDLDPNPLYRYRVIYDNDLEIPSNFMLQHPNVVECSSYRTRRELAELLVPDAVNYRITDGLESFLESRGHKPREIRRAQRFVRRAVREHGLPI